MLCVYATLGFVAGCAVPAPDAPMAASVIVAEAPVGSFFENIAPGPDGAFYITDYTGRRVLRFREGEPLATFANLDAHPLGIQFDADGTLYVSAQASSLFGGGGTFNNAKLIYRARPNQPLTRYLEVPEANFLNGWTRLAPNRLLVADSRGGVIWELDTRRDVVSKYLVDPLLDSTRPEVPTPAANGVKVHQGYLYVSNTIEGTFVRARLDEAGRPGKPELFMSGARADDFAFSPLGTLYYTTHQEAVMRVLGGGVAKPVEAAEGALTGSTALAWGSDGKGPYVITDGGLVRSKSYGGAAPGTAKIVRLRGAD